MSITYSLVSFEGRVLVESYFSPGNHTVIARSILTKIPDKSHKKSYAYQGQVFHYMADENKLVCLCMCDSSVQTRVAFLCLQEIKNRFLTTHGESYQTAPEMRYQDSFSRVLKDLMEYYSNDQNADKFKKVKSDIDEVKESMLTNIDKVLERGDRIENLMDKADLLENQSTSFKKVATALKRSMWW
eukprot:CAMPEP_0177658608 /NCGR_PEP_ID=MMETSP0447-20121125/16917_1 /TAXON_ID=0 /ORGANISM="Stygamoeba regulata, Strain BSH-02190019" /LENGTH=185 /DNA_ID=CAMNT_0019163257 /DNA_START=50 /DNA_END=604 /DNA_ORIENTATION=+